MGEVNTTAGDGDGTGVESGDCGDSLGTAAVAAVAAVAAGGDSMA